MRKIEDRLQAFIEYAEKTRKFSDMAFYEDVLKELRYRQAQIDSLMLQYCPDDMPKEQFDTWAKNQRRVEF